MCIPKYIRYQEEKTSLWNTEQGAVAEWLRWVPPLHRVTTSHMTPVLDGPKKRTRSRVIEISCENLFQNRGKINMFNTECSEYVILYAVFSLAVK